MRNKKKYDERHTKWLICYFSSVLSLIFFLLLFRCCWTIALVAIRRLFPYKNPLFAIHFQQENFFRRHSDVGQNANSVRIEQWQTTSESFLLFAAMFRLLCMHFTIANCAEFHRQTKEEKAAHWKQLCGRQSSPTNKVQKSEKKTIYLLHCEFIFMILFISMKGECEWMRLCVDNLFLCVMCRMISCSCMKKHQQKCHCFFFSLKVASKATIYFIPSFFLALRSPQRYSFLWFYWPTTLLVSMGVGPFAIMSFQCKLGNKHKNK